MQMLKAFFEDDNTHILPRGAAAVKLAEKTYFYSVLKFQTKLIVEVSTEVYRRARN